MSKLAAYVHVRDEKGEPFIFGPPDDIPEWAEEAITNPKAWAEPPSSEGYAGMKAADLKAEIGKRNEGRPDDAKIPATGRKADLVKALEADDARDDN